MLVCGTATPRPESWHELETAGAARAAWTAARCRRWRSSTCEAASAARCIRVRARRSRRSHAPSGKAILLINRRGWSTHLACRSCGHAWQCPHCDVSLVLHRGRQPALPPLRARRAAARGVPRVRLGDDRPGRLGDPAGRGGAGRAARRRSRSSGSTRTARRPAATPRSCGGSTPPSRAFSSGPRWSPRGTTSPRSPSAWSSTRTAPAAARLPLRGAHLRADHPARGPQRPRRGGGPGARAGAGARGRRASGTPPRHDAPASSRGSSERRRELRYPPFSHLIEVALASDDEERVERAAERPARELVGERLAADVDLLGPASAVPASRPPPPPPAGEVRERRHDAVDAVREAVAAAVRDRALRRGLDLGRRGPAIGRRMDPLRRI